VVRFPALALAQRSTLNHIQLGRGYYYDKSAETAGGFGAKSHQRYVYRVDAEILLTVDHDRRINHSEKSNTH
jgi:hypothetical protein